MIYSQCPYCGHSFQIKRDTFGIARMNPTMDERLNNGTYFTHQCSQCHQLYEIEQPFLYRDPKKKYILLLTKQEHIDALPEDEEIIRCQNARDFIYCYRVKSQSLDLDLVTRKRNSLERLKQTRVWFDSYDKKNGCLWFDVKGQWAAIPLSEKEQRVLEGEEQK